jgi:glycosyltransferase involved in cell wall biosynthesis
MRITTNIHGLERVAPAGTRISEYTADRYPHTWSRNLRMLCSALRSDHLVLHFLLTDVIFFSVCLTILPFHRCRVTTLDFFTGPPKAVLLPLLRHCLNRVDRFLVYFKDSQVFEQTYRIEPSRFYYIPFKVNGIEIIEGTSPSDGGYIFSGGRSRRDFATFFSAVEQLGYPVRLVTSSEADMLPHGSSMAGLAIPANVQVSTNDSAQELFLQSMAGARIVVIPIVKDTTTQAGIGVYLQAMALGKCVVISSGLGVSDVLDQGQAVIVPAGDVAALREAIERVWKDASLRERYAEIGYRYARPLGGEDALRRSILQALPD